VTISIGGPYALLTGNVGASWTAPSERLLVLVWVSDPSLVMESILLWLALVMCAFRLMGASAGRSVLMSLRTLYPSWWPQVMWFPCATPVRGFINLSTMVKPSKNGRRSQLFCPHRVSAADKVLVWNDDVLLGVESALDAKH
jgi:hypothetical protein